jgi:hypothetical protein
VETSLNVPMPMITGRVGNYLGYGYGADNGEKAWTDRQWIRVKDFTDSGLRQFYYPPPLGGVSHNWSFLRPTATLTLASGGSALELPFDFASLAGRVVLTADESAGAVLNVVNEGWLRERIALAAEQSGRPLWCAVAPQKGTTRERGPRAELLFAPAADRAYAVTLQYNLNPQALTAANPWAYGGPQHVETIIASCLAVAELRLNDEKGPHHQTFLERLAASVAIDGRNKAHDLGYNGDSSDNLYHAVRPAHGYAGTVTFNGTEY